MARIWQTGAELGSRTAEGGILGGPTISPSAARTGTYGYRHTEPTTAAQLMYRDFTTKRTTTCFLRVYVRIATLPSGTTGMFGIMDSVSNGRVAGVQITATGALQLTDLANAQVGSNSSPLALNTWYRVELKYTATATGAIEACVDGSAFASGNNPSHGVPGWNRIYLGNSVVGAGSGIVADYDDIAINDSSGSAQTGYPGAGGIVHLHPAGTGSSNQWHFPGGFAGNANNWNVVSDIVPDDANGWLESTTLNELDTYTIGPAPPPVASVNVVAIGSRYSNDAASAVSAFKPRLQKTSGGTVAEGSAIVANSTAWATDKDGYALVAYTDPDGAAWTTSTLTSMRIGMKLTADDAASSRVTTLWASVDAVFVPTGTASVLGVSTVVVGARVIRSASSASAGASAVVVAGSVTRPGAATVTALSTVAVDGAAVRLATTSVSASTSLATSAIAVRLGAAQPAAVGDADVTALLVVAGSVDAAGASTLDPSPVLAGAAVVDVTATSALDAAGLIVGQGSSEPIASTALTAAGIAVLTSSAQLAAAHAIAVSAATGDVGAAQSGAVSVTASSAVTVAAARVRVGRVSAAAVSSIVARTSNVIRRPVDGTIRRPGSAWRVASVVCRARGDVHVG